MSVVRIAESAAQTRGLEEFRQLDQASRAQAERIAGENASKIIENQHKEVEQSHRAVNDRTDDERNRERRQSPHRDHDEEPDERKKPRAPLEVPEGHLLDTKA